MDSGTTSRNAPSYRPQPLFPKGTAPESLGRYVSVRGEPIPDYPGKLGYAVVAARRWLGTRGKSLYYTGSQVVYEPVLKADRAMLELDLKNGLCDHLVAKIQEETGLIYEPAFFLDDPATEWLSLWKADGSMLRTSLIFKQGYDKEATGPIHPGMKRPATSDLRGLLTRMRDQATAALDAQRAAIERDAYYQQMVADQEEGEETEPDGNADDEGTDSAGDGDLPSDPSAGGQRPVRDQGDGDLLVPQPAPGEVDPLQAPPAS